MTSHPAIPAVPPDPPDPLDPPDPSETSGRRSLTARNPEDVLAAIPEVLGFVPADSVVMLTFGGAHTFHARADLPAPDRPDEIDQLVAMVLEPALRHRVRGVVLVVYSGDETLARRVSRRLERAFVAHGVEIAMRLRTDGRRWWSPGAPRHGVPYDVSSHPFRVESVLRGIVTHGSREELAATLKPDLEATALVEGRLGDVEPMEALRVADSVQRQASRGRPFSDAALGAVALGLLDQSVREVVCAVMRRPESDAHVRLWSDAVRRTPAHLVGGPAAVLALAAWLAGHGALAWCAVDRAAAADPHDSLAALVAELLERAVPPASWEEVRPSR